MKETMLSTMALDPTSDRFECLRWVSERNAHIPMSELEFLIDVPGNQTDSDDDWCDENWR